MELVGLVVRPRVAPMLATLAPGLPDGDPVYAPNGTAFGAWRSAERGAVELSSRNDRPLARYFPELVEAPHPVTDERFLLDGEIILRWPSGVNFGALMLRLHASPSGVARLRGAPLRFVASTARSADTDLREGPLAEWRARLTGL